jgi:hypothetical protein
MGDLAEHLFRHKSVPAVEQLSLVDAADGRMPAMTPSKPVCTCSGLMKRSKLPAAAGSDAR